MTPAQILPQFFRQVMSMTDLRTTGLYAAYRRMGGTDAELSKPRAAESASRAPRPDVSTEECAALYKSGLSLEKVAERLGVTRTTVSRRLHEAGVELRAPCLHTKGRLRDDVTAEKILELKAQGLTHQQAAERLGCSRSLVALRVREAARQ